MPLNSFRIAVYISLHFICLHPLYAQKTNKKALEHKIRVGMNYGQASQARFPFDSPDYMYENKYFKAQINYLLKQKNKFRFEIHFEPSVYKSRHQLLNEYYVQPNSGPNYLKLRELYTQETIFYEYALNLGIMVRFVIFKPLSTYFIGSVGPMYGEEDTERLRKGLAFSDYCGIGISYQIGKIIIDMRSTLRHCSNAGLYEPNSGHNSTGVEAGISYEL